MKKKILLLFGAMCLITCVFAASWKWEKVNDSCGKCEITETKRICGKCSGFLKESKKPDDEKNYLVYTFKCKKCNHRCVYKIRYE